MTQKKLKSNIARTAALALVMSSMVAMLTSCVSESSKSDRQCIPVPLIPEDALIQRAPPQLSANDDIVEYILDLLHIIDIQNGSIEIVNQQVTSAPKIGCH